MELKFALIGCGRIAQRHAAHIVNKGILLAVCDLVKDKADDFATTYGCAAYYDIDLLLQKETEADVVVICTPNGCHAAHSIKALRAGFHVLCEKPMALTVTDCSNMIKAAQESGKKLFTIKQNRFNPPVQAVKKAIEENRLGRIYNIQLSCFWNRDAAYYQNSWKGSLELDGGTLYTQFSHFIDLLYWMIGDISEVKAYLSNYAHQDMIEFEDSGVVILKFENGAMGTINYSVNAHARNMEGSLTILAEKGTVKIGGQYLNELEYQDIENYRIENLPAGNPANQYGSYSGSMSNHDKVYDNLIATLQQNAVYFTTSLEGMKTVEIIEKIYRYRITH